MKIQVRRSVFETNSSSVHSLTFCSQSEFDRWKKGELVFDGTRDKLVEITEENKPYIYPAEGMECSKYDLCYSYEDFMNGRGLFGEYETEIYSATIDGVEVNVIGYFGYNG